MHDKARGRWARPVGFAFLLCVAVVGRADTRIYVPCPTWNVGDYWESTLVAGGRELSVSSVVKSRDRNRVVVTERITSVRQPYPNAPRGTKPVRSIQSADQVYEVVGGNVALRQHIGDVSTTYWEPPQPFCGQVPRVVAYRVKSTNPSGTAMTETTQTIRSLGNQRVSSPAGTFDAVAIGYEFVHKDAVPDRPTESRRRESTGRIYWVDRLGKVRAEHQETVMRPVMTAGAPDPRAAGALGEGLSELSRGGNTADTLRRLQELDRDGRPTFEAVKLEIVMELQRYEPSK